MTGVFEVRVYSVKVWGFRVFGCGDMWRVAA